MKRRKVGAVKKKDLHAAIKAERKRQRKEYECFYERIFEDVSVTADISGEPLISLAGRHCMLVQNYLSIAEYTSQKIRLKTERYDLVVEGASLFLEYSLMEELKIRGDIQSIHFGKASGEL